MELQQLTDVKAVNGKKAEHKSSADTQQNSPFEDQLNKQIDQTKSSVSEEKSNINQQDEVVANDQSVTGQEPQAENVESEETGIEAIQNTEVTNESLAGDLIATDTSSAVAGIATQISDTGKSLPHSTVVSPVVKTMDAVQSTANIQLAAASIQSPGQSVDISGSSVKAMVDVNTAINNGLVKNELVTADLRSFQPLNPLDKPGLQNIQPASMTSEMPVTDIIAKATKMQQVPLSTAVSASLGASQNVNTSSAVNVLNTDLALNNSTALSNNLQSSISANISSPKWSQQMTDQVSVMLKGGYQQAEIKINPAHLGPMEIKLSVNDDQASINFVAQHAPVRDALDASIPRLREMLEQQGLNLSDVDVSTQSEQQQASDETLPGDKSESDTVAGDADGMSSQHNAVINIDVNSGVSIYA